MIALALAVLAGQVWIVDQDLGPGADFQAIQPAIDVAAPGDAVIVRAGDYAALDLRKPVFVFGEGRDVVRVRGGVSTVQGLPPGTAAGLSGVLVHLLDVSHCGGSVLLDDVHLIAGWSGLSSPRRAALEVRDSADVRIHRSTVESRTGPHDGLLAVASRVELVESIVNGGTGPYTDSGPGSPGSRAITLLGGSRVTLHQARVRGGQGECRSGEDDPGGPGGAGVELRESSVVLAGTALAWILGGTSGYGSDITLDGVSGDGLVLVGESAARHSGVRVEAGTCGINCGQAIVGVGASTPARPDPVLLERRRPDGTRGLRVFGPPGAPVALTFGTTPVVQPAAGPVEVLVAARHEVVRGVLPPWGFSDFDLRDLTGRGGVLTLVQAEVTYAPTDARRTNSLSFLRPPSPCPIGPGDLDCDADGQADVCEVEHGLDSDCDGDGLLDGCEIVLGAADDNEDGIPDTCRPFATIAVDDDAPGDPGPGDPTLSDPLEDGSPAHPFDSIAEAVAAARPGDVVTVAAGTYRGAGNLDVDLDGRELAIVGAGADVTRIDPEGQGRCFTVTGGADVRLEGLCFIDAAGGAVRALYSELRVRECVFRGNQQGVDADLSEIEVRACTFRANWSASGGAASFGACRGTVLDCLFEGNSSPGDGGALGLFGGELRVERCRFRGNRAARGGAVLARPKTEETTGLADCVFTDNRATFLGGAVHVLGGECPVALLPQRCTFVGNAAGVGGGALDVSGGVGPQAVVLENAIFWSNSAPIGGQVRYDAPKFLPGTLLIGFADVEGGLPGIALDVGNVLFETGANLGVNPGFAADGWHLSIASPLIDAGPLGPLLPEGARDIDGQRRVQGERIDVGADEVR